MLCFRSLRFSAPTCFTVARFVGGQAHARSLLSYLLELCCRDLSMSLRNSSREAPVCFMLDFSTCPPFHGGEEPAYID